jgi:DNA modification methylase
MVFADPPYFLSNNGLSIQNGQIVCVNKGKWDKSDDINNKLFHKFLPALTTWERVIKAIDNTKFIAL